MYFSDTERKSYTYINKKSGLWMESIVDDRISGMIRFLFFLFHVLWGMFTDAIVKGFILVMVCTRRHV